MMNTLGSERLEQLQHYAQATGKPASAALQGVWDEFWAVNGELTVSLNEATAKSRATARTKVICFPSGR